MTDASETPEPTTIPSDVDGEPRRGGWRWMVIALVFAGVIVMALVTSKPQAAPEVYLHQIVVKVDLDVSGDYERAKAKIARVREEVLQPGRSFAVIAMQQGESLTAIQDNPGEVGWIGRGFVPPHVEAVVFALEIDEISEIVEDAHGFRILMITEKRGNHP